MKVLQLTKYGSPRDFEIIEIPKPVPREGEVLLKVHATAINDYDWCLMRGKPYVYRLMFGLRKPKNPVFGMELAGVVADIGHNATRFTIGDAVYGDISEYGFGTFAEYICVNEKALTLKPEAMPFIEAAAIPHAAMLAWQGLVDAGHIQQQQKILINGAGGGVGTLALCIAKLYKAEVSGVDTGDKLASMQAIGFDNVIDYKVDDFTKMGQQYDLILDTKTCLSPTRYLSALSANGRYVTVGGHLNRLLQVLLFKPLLSFFSKKSLYIVSLKVNKNLEHMNKLYLEGHLKPLIDGPYALHEVPGLIEYFGAGSHAGKIVINLITKQGSKNSN